MFGEIRENINRELHV